MLIPQRLSCITAFGRPEFTYLEAASTSLVPIAERHDLEWIVACDGLDADLVVESTHDFPVRPVVVPAPTSGNTSAGETRNRALAAATGDLLLTLDADDLYQPEPMLELIELVGSGRFVYAAGLADDINANGSFRADPPLSLLQTGPVELGAYYDHWCATGSWPWHPSATVVRLDAVRAIGGWPGRGPLRDDEDTFVWSTLNRHLPGFFTRDVVMSYRVHDASVTKQPDYASSKEPGLYERVWAEMDVAAALKAA